MPSAAEKKEFIAFKMSVTSAEDDGSTGHISGLCSIFGSVDQGCDIVQPGAFSRTIKAQNGVFPFLLDHDPYKPAGYSTSMIETDKGLQYEAEVKLFDPEVKQRFELAKLSKKLGKPMGNSFGYCAVKYDYEEIEMDGMSMMVRNLREIKLFEASLVMFPMHEGAGITDAKSMDELLAIMKKGSYSIEELKTALASLKERPAAEDEIDPALRHSMDAFRTIFK